MDDITVIHTSAKYVMLRLLGTLFIIETIYALIIMVYIIVRPDLDKQFILALWVIHTIKFIFIAFFLGDVIIRFLGIRYFITTHHLIVSRGLVVNDEKIYELEQVRKISTYQDILGKKLNYGNVILLLGARGYEEHLTLVNVANPRHIMKEIEKFFGTIDKKDI